MSKKLYDYFLRELDYLYQQGKRFAREYPDVAGHLDLQDRDGEDPYVRRLSEAFAFLTARSHLRLDEGLGQFAGALLEQLLPVWTRPWPAGGVLEFALADESNVGDFGISLPRHSRLVATEEDGGAYHFRTCKEAKGVRLSVENASLGNSGQFPELVRTSVLERAPAILQISLAHLLKNFPVVQQIERTLTFFIQAGDLQHTLHEFLLNPLNLAGITLQVPGKRELWCEVPISNLRCCGFQREELMLESLQTLPLGYQILTEVLAYPFKHFFFELTIPEAFQNQFRTADGKWRGDLPGLQINFFFNQSRKTLESSIKKDNFLLNCVPVLNVKPEALVQQTLDRITVDHLLDLPGPTGELEEIYRLDSVEAFRDGTWTFLQPAFSVQARGLGKASYYHAWREGRFGTGEAGTDLKLSLLDENFDPYKELGFEKLRFKAESCDRRLNSLSRLKSLRSFKFQGLGEFRTLAKPVEGSWARMRSAPSGSELWTLFSLLNLNYQLFGGDRPVAGLRELLEILNRGEERERTDFSESLGVMKSVKTRPCVDRLDYSTEELSRGVAVRGAVVRGMTIEYSFDIQGERRPGYWYLLALGLDQLAGLHVSINSFTRTKVVAERDNMILAEFSKRCGSAKLI